MEYGKLIRSSLLLLVVLFSGCDNNIAYTVDGFSVKVVDAVTKLPVEGAVVVAVYRARYGTHGSSGEMIHYSEAATDRDGVAYMEPWAKKGLKKGFDYYDPSIKTYKDGYNISSRITLSERIEKGGVINVTNIRTQQDILLRSCNKGREGDRCLLEQGSAQSFLGSVVGEDSLKLPLLSQEVRGL